MRNKATISDAQLRLLQEKAARSSCTYKVSAIAFDKHGDVLGHVTNCHSRWDVLDKTPLGRAGTATHAERRLLARYGSNVKTIVICRVGKAGTILPIDPCPTCKKVAAKLGARIVSVLPGNGKNY